MYLPIFILRFLWGILDFRFILPLAIVYEAYAFHKETREILGKISIFRSILFYPHYNVHSFINSWSSSLPVTITNLCLSSSSFIFFLSFKLSSTRPSLPLYNLSPVLSPSSFLFVYIPLSSGSLFLLFVIATPSPFSSDRLPLVCPINAL